MAPAAIRTAKQIHAYGTLMIILGGATTLSCGSSPDPLATRARDTQGRQHSLLSKDSLTAIMVIGAQCVACRVDAPDLRRLRTALLERGIATRHLLVGAVPEAASLKSLYGTDELIVDSASSVIRRLGVDRTPSVILLTPDGKVLLRQISLAGIRIDALVASMAALSAKRSE